MSEAPAEKIATKENVEDGDKEKALKDQDESKSSDHHNKRRQRNSSRSRSRSRSRSPGRRRHNRHRSRSRDRYGRHGSPRNRYSERRDSRSWSRSHRSGSPYRRRYNSRDRSPNNRSSRSNRSPHRTASDDKDADNKSMAQPKSSAPTSELTREQAQKLREEFKSVIWQLVGSDKVTQETTWDDILPAVENEQSYILLKDAPGVKPPMLFEQVYSQNWTRMSTLFRRMTGNV